MPVAVNLYKIRDAKTAGGDLFRSVQRQQPQYQGIWIVTPEGKVLSAHHEIKSHATWTREVLDALQAGLKAYGPVAPRQVADRDPLPYRGKGIPPDGTACLALTARCVRGGGQEQAPASVPKGSLWLWDGPVKPDGPPVIDSVALSAAEWALFVPKKGTPGEVWSLPESVARKFSRALSPSSDQSLMPRPDEALVAEIKAKVVSVEGDRLTVRLTGHWETRHIYDGKASYGRASAKGTVICERKSPRSFLLAFSGAFRMPPPYDNGDRPIGAVVEWTRD